MFFTLPTRWLTGQQIIPSEGYGTSKDFSCAGSAGSSPSHVGDFHETRDTGFLLARLEELWKRVPRYKPLSVDVVLLDLVPADQHQPDLFTADNHRRQKLSPLIAKWRARTRRACSNTPRIVEAGCRYTRRVNG